MPRTSKRRRRGRSRRPRIRKSQRNMTRRRRTRHRGGTQETRETQETQETQEAQERKKDVLAVVTNNGRVFKLLDPMFQKEREIVLAAVTQYGLALEHADPMFQKDREIVLAAVTNHGQALEYADRTLQNDPEIVLAAISPTREESTGPGKYTKYMVHRRGILRFAGEDLLKDPDFLLQVLEKNPSVVHEGFTTRCPGFALMDRTMTLQAVTQNGLVLGQADPTFQNDPEIVLAAVTENVLALAHADPTLQNDPGIVLAAVTQNLVALKYADPTLKTNKDIALAIAEIGGPIAIGNRSFEWVDEGLRSDKQFVLQLVQKNGLILEWVDRKLQADREIVNAAVKQDKHALLWARYELKVKTMSGHSITVTNLRATTLVEDIISQIQTAESMSAADKERATLLYNQETLDGDRTLFSYGIVPPHIGDVYLILRPIGEFPGQIRR